MWSIFLQNLHKLLIVVEIFAPTPQSVAQYWAKIWKIHFKVVGNCAICGRPLGNCNGKMAI